VRDKKKTPKPRITLSEFYALLGVLESARKLHKEINILERSWARFLDFEDENCWFSEILYDDKAILPELTAFIETHGIKILNKELKNVYRR